MPPSPALRCSPGRELRGETHKRGRSFESGLLLKEKDDDLALFNEMQTREKESFLLQSSDDMDDMFSTKLRQFSDLKIGISIPARGEGSELLNADGEKNDYDWLLTPPDTPLFPSLDDEPTSVGVARRGRPRSQPISISRSSTMEKSQRSSRGSASPNRLSPSPRSGNSSFQSTRGRPGSPHLGSAPVMRPATPTRRPSPSPSKALTPGPRSSTPTQRRMSTGSGGTVTSSGVRGTSPVRTSRGNSASPKIRAWQSNIPGFSSEVPPNLRTSLADRPASYVRGSSPASRNGRESTSKFTRQQSMSPTATRSVSSSHSHDRDRFSSQSKGSVVSSGDDDADSLQSIPIGSSDRSKRVGAFPNNRSPSVSKKSVKMLSSSSAPKRSFDSALRQMDHRKSPTNMFRPLLSSVPSTTFYVGKGSSGPRSMISRNSSITTSSNSSFDQGTSLALDTEGSDHQQDETATDCGEVLCPSAQEEVFAFDKMDALDKDIEYESNEIPNLQLVGSDRDPAIDDQPAASEELSHHDIEMETSPTTNGLSASGDFSGVASSENIRLCSQCGLKYAVVELVEKDINLCPACRKQGDLGTLTISDTSILGVEHTAASSVEISEEIKQDFELKPSVGASELPSQDADTTETRFSGHQELVEQSQTLNSEESQKSFGKNAVAMALVEEDEQSLSYVEEIDKSAVRQSLHDREVEQLQLSNNYPDTNVDNSEGAGISLLLKRSSSSKGPVIQGRTFTASTITYGDLSYVRDSTSSLRSSFGHGSTSASSSVDFSSSRQIESRLQRQLSDRKSDKESSKYDANPQSTVSSLSGNSNLTHQSLGPQKTFNENFEVSVGDIKNNDEGLRVASQCELLASENKEAGIANIYLTGETVPREGIIGHIESRTTDASTSEMSSHTASIRSEQNSVAFFPNREDHCSYENEEDILKMSSNSDAEAAVITADSSYEEQRAMITDPDEADVGEVPAQSSLATITEIEVENSCEGSPESHISCISPESESVINEVQESSVPPPSDNDLKAVHEPNPSDHSHSISEESTVWIESHEGNKAKSLTLEEATDAILFCSSIVHDLAYQAANIAIENENAMELDNYRPTVTVLGKSNNPDRRDSRSSRPISKHNSKSQKTKQKRAETNEKPPPNKTENDENTDQSTMRNVGLPNNKVDSMKAPPKLESKCNCTIM